MTEQEVKELTCLKHVKIYKLKQLGLKNSEIAKALGTNAGHVYNSLKMYDGNIELQAKANAL